jgi:hypothetical protein
MKQKDKEEVEINFNCEKSFEFMSFTVILGERFAAFDPFYFLVFNVLYNGMRCEKFVLTRRVKEERNICNTQVVQFNAIIDNIKTQKNTAKSFDQVK